MTASNNLANSVGSTALATVSLTAQSAAQAATTLYTPASDGLFTINYYAKVTTAATTSSTLGVFSVISTDTDSNVVTSVGQSTQQNSLTTGFISGSITVYAKASTPIQYSLAYASSGATAMQYELRVVVAGTTAPSSTGTVSSFNGRTGAVTPGSSDYTAAQVGAVSYLSTQAGKNFVINGGMDIAQRGTSISIPNALTYSLDRWCSYPGSAGQYTISQITSLGLTGFKYAARIQRTSGNSITTGIAYASSIETINSIPMAGQTVTVSFWARAGSNYSATSNLLTAQVAQGTGTDQNVINGFTGSTNVINQTPTLTTSWQQFTYTGTVNLTSTELAIYFSTTPTGTAGANDYFDITGVQLEIGSTATAFSRAGGTIQGELAACQRYYYQQGLQSYDVTLGIGSIMSSTSAAFLWNFPVIMRTQPSISSNNVTYAFYLKSAAVSLTYASTLGTWNASTSSAQGFFTTTGLTAGQACYINTSGLGFVSASAEL